VKPVEVVWKDACLRTKSYRRGKAGRKGLMLRRTVGYLVKLTRRRVVIAMTDDGRRVDDVYVIPRAWATKIHNLRRER
jgi:hypothetical protein